MALKPVKAGIVGCGNISGIYFQAKRTFPILDIVAAADLDVERAKARATEYGVARVCTLEEMLADKDIEIIINLTTPHGHAPVNMAAIEAGKSAHTEKPFAITREDGKKVLAAAKAKKVLVGGAPDTFMGAGIQTCLKLIKDGAIGRPIGATAFMLCHGHESWHPDPEFYYEKGGGPMFDMGPYYLTALVALMGPVKRVAGATAITFPERTITSAKKNGKKVKVEVPTHVTGVMNFANGAIGTIITSFDVWGHRLPCIEIYGEKGTLWVPDPNGFGGPVTLQAGGAPAEVALTHGYADNSRGIGAADMAYALRTGRKHRSSGELAYHVLDIMHAFHDSSDTGRHINLESTCEQPAPMPTGLKPGELDE